ncbi:MAG: M24 family metallopeptidase [Candidatus Omnitrophota bacterium]
MDRKEEFKIKVERLRKFLVRHKKQGVLIGTQANFSWVTAGGENRVNTATESGAAEILVTRDDVFLIANNIEKDRILEEEVSGLPIKPLGYPWYKEKEKVKVISRVTDLFKILSDAASSGGPVNLSPLHFPLTEPELDRYRELGKKVGEGLTETAQAIKPGQKETEIAAIMAGIFLADGIVPIVILVAADERTAKFRHPLPTENRLKNYVMLVVCGRKNGLVASATRLVSFRKISPELRKKHQAVACVDAAFILETTPGIAIGKVFKAGVKAYRETGFPQEWHRHHQGGPTGYQPRYFKAFLTEKRKVVVNSAFAWNPSITGTKSEDTILITKTGEPEIISTDATWPMIEVEYRGKKINRPDIMLK